MFAIPKLPRLPSILSPATQLAAVRSLLIRPKTIDYTSVPLLAAKGNSTEKPSRDAHSGPYANLPLSSCPICYQRRKATPAPIGEGSAASDIALPPIDVSGGEDEETVFIPAETDCWGGCRWCYYCIAGELARHAEVVAAAEIAYSTKKGRTDEKTTVAEITAEKWTCLRCGGGVSRAWRVGAEVPSNEVGQDDQEKQDNSAERPIKSSVV